MESNKSISTLQSELQNLKQTVCSLTEKYQSCMNEVKTKDDFLKQYLMARTEDSEAREYIDSMLQKYNQGCSKDEE